MQYVHTYFVDECRTRKERGREEEEEDRILKQTESAWLASTSQWEICLKRSSPFAVPKNIPGKKSARREIWRITEGPGLGRRLLRSLGSCSKILNLLGKHSLSR